MAFAASINLVVQVFRAGFLHRGETTIDGGIQWRCDLRNTHECRRGVANAIQGTLCDASESLGAVIDRLSLGCSHQWILLCPFRDALHLRSEVGPPSLAATAQRGELNAVQLAAVEDNLKDAPLTAQMVAQGRLKPHQVLDPAEVASYEQALTEQRVKVDREGRETVKRDTRLAAQPVLTRYVEDARVGGKRYRPPRFAGPAY